MSCLCPLTVNLKMFWYIATLPVISLCHVCISGVCKDKRHERGGRSVAVCDGEGAVRGWCGAGEGGEGAGRVMGGSCVL